ncbi:hypothetical protein B0T10DRAFT_607797 [Thelonectria olida]|uniref:Uncharacterized protein n=1 Tax=Thelonectria olida TaxID=1576542 RepID=A0A9P8W3G8_9HYPO|nr:hypothetical protein B0T10DRAFT_607797 [Thelonectria olida]
MTSGRDLTAILGFPDIAQGERLASLSSPTETPSFEHSPSDQAEARQLLIQVRTTDPAYKDVYQKKRYIFHTKQKKQSLANPDHWHFTQNEIGRALHLYFEDNRQTWRPIGIARALLDMATDNSATSLWELAQDHRSKWAIAIESKQPSMGVPCPWLDLAVERRQLPTVVMLCRAGMDQSCSNLALVKALRLKAYDIAEELLRFHAELPLNEELYLAALASPIPDLDFIRLWLSAPSKPIRQHAINAMSTAAGTRSPTDEMKTALSTLLANVEVSPEEAYHLLNCAISAQNIEAMAAISLAIGGSWTCIKGQGAISAVAAAVQIADHSLRYRVLNFLLSAGAKADTTILRKQLFVDGKRDDMNNVRLLIGFGVSPHQAGYDTDLLSWTVANARMDVFHVIMEAEIPPHVASPVVDKIPHDASETDKVSIVMGLGRKGASGLPLSRLLLRAVQSSSDDLTRALVGLKASADFIDDEGANSLYVAVVRGDAALARLLCTTNPKPSVVSAAVRLTFDALMNNSVDTMLEILSLLAEHGASGDPVECTLIKAITTPVCLDVLAILLPTGLSLTAGGRAVGQAIKLAGTEALDLICATANVTTQSLETSLMEVIYGTHYSSEKARILARMAQRQGYNTTLDWVLVNPKRKNHPCGEEIIDMLLSHGASVDVGGGVLLVDALEQGNKEALTKLLRRNPSTSSLTTALGAICNSHTKDQGFEFTRLLLGASESDIGQSRTLLQLVQEAHPDPPDLVLVTLLLEHNASVDHANGEVLHLAAKGLLLELAEVLLTTKPSIATVERAFRTALHSLDSPRERLQMMELLLSSGVRLDSVSQALVEEIESKPTNQDAAVLLLTYGASVNDNSGLALVHAVRAGLYEHVQLLSSCQEGLQEAVASRAFQTARDAELEHQQRSAIYELLLSHPIDQNELDAALLAACTTQEHEPTAALLVRNGATVEFRNGQALVSIVEGEKASLLRTVLLGNGRPPSNDTMRAAFEAALRLSNPTRLSICQILIQQGVDAETRSTHLIDAIKKQDPDLLALMLDPDHIMWNVDQDSLKYAVSHGLAREVELLVEYSVPDQMVSTAFEGLVRSKCFTTSNEIKIATKLLSVGLDIELRNNALHRAISLSSSELPAPFIKLLLEHDADPATHDGICFGQAAEKDNLDVFQELTARPFDLNLALRSLIIHLHSEVDLAKWIDVCIKQHRNTGASATNDDTLLRFLIERFPDGKTALARLLDQSYDPGLVFAGDEETGTSEEITLVIWALSKKGGATDDVIIELLSRGSLAKPDFTCQSSGFSAVHLAALRDRPRVLRQLVDLGVDIDLEETTGRTPLHLATESRNVECMTILLKAGAKPDDGSLHVAARSVDVECISLLKQHGHDVLFPMDLFNGRTPAAELCLNASGLGPRWAKSMQEAMKLLMPFPPHTWKFDGKTILHLAIDNPNAAAPILGSLLYLSRVRESPGKDDDYLFTDTKSGLHYSPTMYVHHLCPSKDEPEKKELIKSLATHRFIDRYFAESGSQPLYATGLPQALRDAIVADKQADWKQKQELRRAQLLADHRQGVAEESHRRKLQHQDMKNEKEVEMIRRRGDAQLEQQQRKQTASYSHQEKLLEMKMSGKRRGAEQALEWEMKRGQELGTQKMSLKAQQYMMDQAHARVLQEHQYQHQQRQLESQRRGAEEALARDMKREKELGRQKLTFAAQQYIMEQAHKGALQQHQQRLPQPKQPQQLPGRKNVAAIEYRPVSDSDSVISIQM